MNENQIQYDDEINLAEIAQTIWDGKWIIVAITSISIIGGGLFSVLAPKSFSGSLEIRPIPLSQSQQYNELNTLEFFTITPAVLLDRFIEDISQRESLAQSIIKFSSIKKNNAESEDEFANRVLSTAYNYKLIAPTSGTEGRNREIKPHWTIEFNVSEPSTEAIQLILNDALNRSTENVRTLTSSLFEQKVSITERSQRYTIEDLRLSVSNQKEDYEKQVRNRLAFLSEQAQIARSLGISKNTIETQTFQTGTSFVANVVSETPFYLRGYEAIEKEVKLLQTRKGIEAFIAELIEIENKKRSIEQDKTIERSKVAFQNSPMMEKEFSAVFYDIASIEFKPNVRASMILALAFIGGGFLSLLVVLIRSSILKYKNKQQS
jgi:LPS O-antigen subunit length determinant protein (WzzB/FepE family)